MVPTETMMLLSKPHTDKNHERIQSSRCSKMNSNSFVKHVDHTYRDFSKYIDNGGKLIKHKKSEANFPAKLHKMLAEPANSHVITWMPHGRAWKILDKDLLFSEVLPQYYVCKKFESFTRQLNGWGFKRLHQSGPDSGCYYHECLLRGLPKLTCLIRRLPPNLGKATPHPAGEPNFYRISEVYPLPPVDRGGASNSSSAAPSSTINQGGNNAASTIKAEGSSMTSPMLASQSHSTSSSRRECLDSMSPSLHSPQSSPPQEPAPPNYAMSITNSQQDSMSRLDNNALPTSSAAPEVHFHAPPSHTAPPLPPLPNPPLPPPPPPNNNHNVEPIAYRSPSIRPLSEEYSVGFAAGLAHAAATMERQQRSPRMQHQQHPTMPPLPPLMTTTYSQDRGYHHRVHHDHHRQMDRHLDRQMDRHLEPLIPSGGHGGRELYNPSRYSSNDHNQPSSSSTSTSGYSASQSYPLEYAQHRQQQHHSHPSQVRPATLYRHRSHQPTPTHAQYQQQQQQQRQHPSPSGNNGTAIGPDMDEHRARMNYEQTHALNTAAATPIGGGGGIGPSVGPSGGPPRPSADALAMQGRSKSCPDHFGDRRQRQGQQEQREGANRSPVIEPIPYARVDTAKDGEMAVGDSPVVHKHNV